MKILGLAFILGLIVCLAALYIKVVDRKVDYAETRCSWMWFGAFFFVFLAFVAYAVFKCAI